VARRSPSCDVAAAVKRAAPDERISPIGSLATRPAAAGSLQSTAELPMRANDLESASSAVWQ
jgi:hypothetical protein